MSVSDGHNLSYEHLYSKTDTPFTEWVEREMNLKREDFVVNQKAVSSSESIAAKTIQSIAIEKSILAAIRTKPFILLAGISGTGKSRMVR